jgi:cytochrome c oxidase cbb3-type subunit I/II
MKDPKATSPQSIMPAYTWLYDARLDTSHIEGKIITLRRLGVPYPEGYERQAETDLKAQADKIAAGLTQSGLQTSADKEIIALIAYLQRLGTDIKSAPSPAIASAPSAATAGGQ